jgi:hypothetical protein
MYSGIEVFILVYIIKLILKRLKLGYSKKISPKISPAFLKSEIKKTSLFQNDEVAKNLIGIDVERQLKLLS